MELKKRTPEERAAYFAGWNAALEMVAGKQTEWAAHCTERACEFHERMQLKAYEEANVRAREADQWAKRIIEMKQDPVCLIAVGT
jgi:hypothetical protein